MSHAYSNEPLHNIVRDYNLDQGTTHPSDLSYQILRDYNVRYITVQNSSNRPIGVSITPYISGPTPEIGFILEGGEIKHLGINCHGGPVQYIWMIDIQTLKPVGAPTWLRSDANDFVLRDGVTKCFISFFKRPSYAASH